MSYLKPLKIDDIDLNELTYSKVKENNNKKIINLKYSNNNFVFQTPTLTNINSAIIYDDYAELDISLIGKKKNNIVSFTNFLSDLESKIKDDSKIYASRWFNLNSQHETINFQKIIRDNNTLKIKLIKNDDFETITQLNNNDVIPFNNIPENSWCKIILQCYAIWINNNNDFGIFFRPILISFTEKIKKVYNYNFIEDSDDNNSPYNIPDTDINQSSNIFLKVPSKSTNNVNNETTSQLECNILYNSLINNEEKLSRKSNIILTNNNNNTSENNLSEIKNNYSSSSEKEHIFESSSDNNNEKYQDSDSSIDNLDLETVSSNKK